MDPLPCVLGRLGGQSACAGSPTGSSPSSSSSQVKCESFRRFKFSDFSENGEIIGSGSCGHVTKVLHKTTGEVFAMKAIPRQKVLENQMVPYLLREVRTHLKLRHPNIIRLHYYFEDEGHIHLLLEYAGGGSLFSLLRREGSFTEPKAAKTFLDVARALHFLHRHRIIHRDLKPENILLCPGPEGDVAKLADFGWCADVLHDGSARNTFCGTWDYLSPEMVMGEPHSHWVDVWAIGVLLYELLTGKAPFAAKSQVKAMQRVLAVDLKFPPSVSTDAETMVRRLLAKEPEERIALKDTVYCPFIKQHIADPERGFGIGTPPSRLTSKETGLTLALAKSVKALEAVRSERARAPVLEKVEEERAPEKSPGGSSETPSLSHLTEYSALKARIQEMLSTASPTSGLTQTPTATVTSVSSGSVHNERLSPDGAAQLSDVGDSSLSRSTWASPPKLPLAPREVPLGPAAAEARTPEAVIRRRGWQEPAAPCLVRSVTEPLPCFRDYPLPKQLSRRGSVGTPTGAERALRF